MKWALDEHVRRREPRRSGRGEFQRATDELSAGSSLYLLRQRIDVDGVDEMSNMLEARTALGQPLEKATAREGEQNMDWKLEVVILPVADVDSAKAFYTEKLGFTLDVDHHPNDSFRVVQMTPPGSACSITIGIGVTDAEPGSVRGMHLIVDDIEAAHEQLVGAGVDVGAGIQHFEDGTPVPGPDPERRDFNSFIFFADPDGNTWAVQHVNRKEPAT